MPHVRLLPQAVRDIDRLCRFLAPKNPEAAKRARQTILQNLRILGNQPNIGRLVEGLPEIYRECLIHFGDSGYVARYRVDADCVNVLAVRHQKEAGFVPGRL